MWYNLISHGGVYEYHRQTKEFKMKMRVENPCKEFKPVTLSITFESLNEIESLVARLNASLTAINGSNSNRWTVHVDDGAFFRQVRRIYINNGGKS